MNSKQTANLERAFRKYDADQKGYLNKLEFKCAFIFLTGLQPSKQDMVVIRQYMESTKTEGERMQGMGSAFLMGWGEFQRVMDIYMRQIDDKAAVGSGAGKGQAEIENIWREMTSQS